MSVIAGQSLTTSNKKLKASERCFYRVDESVLGRKTIGKNEALIVENNQGETVEVSGPHGQQKWTGMDLAQWKH